jgi:hypothetical protein
MSKSENLKQQLQTEIARKNTRWRHKTKPEERLASTLRLLWYAQLFADFWFWKLTNVNELQL